MTVVFHGIGDIRLDNVPEPKIQHPMDATINMGNCNHRKYIPTLVDLVESGAVNPKEILTQQEPLMSALDAYQAFDKRQPGWVKVELIPGM